jgi:hypothetical protein
MITNLRYDGTMYAKDIYKSALRGRAVRQAHTPRLTERPYFFCATTKALNMR